MKSPLITLTTDFGESDPFVGIMKGVIAGIAPGVPLVDITHAIPPGDIQRGAIVLWQSVPYFPQGTVFLAVVDPGVGTERKGIILHVRGQIFVGPNNGLFSYLLAEGESVRAWELVNTSLGDLPPSPSLEITSPQELRGEILTTDQFGNLLTSLGRFIPTKDGQLQLSPWLEQRLPMVKFSPDKARVLLPNGQSLPFVNTFA
ncbi:MAG: hypothetical protein B6I38_07000, partial [Anaerolineaceae bacterium 4572_5.1]